MRLLFRLLGVAFFLAVVVLVVFVLWGGVLEEWIFARSLGEDWGSLRSVAWLLGIVLLISDILLPIPSTVVLSGLGAVYGFVLGSVVGCVGLVFGGCVGYGLGGLLGPRVLTRLGSLEEVEQAGAAVGRWGGWVVALSRSLPILPEVVSVMAGLMGMSFSRFFLALVAGSVPMACLFSYIGVYALKQPVWGVAFSVLVPGLLWGGARFLLLEKGGTEE